MGSFALVQNKSQTIMKVLLFVALAIAAVVAEPEAEAGAPNPYFGPPYQPRYYGHLGYAITKPTLESAEAAKDATTTPTFVYGHPAVYGHPLATTVVKAEDRVHGAFVPNKVVVPGQVGHAVYPYAGILGSSVLGVTHYAVKREAEAEPEAEAKPEADAWYRYYGHPYGSYYGYPHRYGYGYYGYGHRYFW